MTRSLPGCYVVSEARLVRNGGDYWDPRQSFPEGHWQECLEVFGQVTVLARTARTFDAPGDAVVFPGDVHVGELPYYQGPVAAAGKMGKLVFTARRLLRPRRPCILRVPGFVPGVVWCWLRHYRMPYAVEVLGDPEQVFKVVNHPLRRIWRVLFSRLQKAIIERAGAVMYISDALARSYAAPPHARTFVVSDVRLTTEAFAQPRVFTAAPRPLRLIHVGNMEQSYKGHDYLLKAISDCRRHGFEVEATLVGDGRLRAHYEALSAALGLSEVVRFRGSVRWGTDLFQILDRADLFVMSSLTEGLGKALLEGMARGLPAVGSAVGGIPELLSPDELVPPADERALAAKIVEIGATPERLTPLARQNYQRALEYRDEVLSHRRLEFYEAVKASFSTER